MVEDYVIPCYNQAWAICVGEWMDVGMCGPKGYGFSAVLVINRVAITAILPPLW